MAIVVTRSAVISFLRGQIFASLPGDPTLQKALQGARVSIGAPLNYAQADKVVDYLDALDHNGRPDSFVAWDEKGQQTPSGVLTDHLGENLGVTGLTRSLGLEFSRQKTLMGRELSTWLAFLGPRMVTLRSEENRRLIENTGIGKYYGIESTYNKIDVLKDGLAAGKRITTPGEKTLWIDAHKKPGALPDWPIESSCIGFVLEVLDDVYRHLALVDPGLLTTWQKVRAKVEQSKFLGTVLCTQLQLTTHWDPLYWITDTAAQGDKGMQASWAQQLWQTSNHFGIKIPRERQMRNWRVEPLTGTAPDPVAPQMLARLNGVPFGVGIAKGGYHVLGTLGNGAVPAAAHTWEVHWRAEPSDSNLIDTHTPFNEIPWISGCLMLPAGLFEKPLTAAELAAVAP